MDILLPLSFFLAGWYAIGLTATVFAFWKVANQKNKSILDMWQENYVLGLVYAITGPLNWYYILHDLPNLED